MSIRFAAAVAVAALAATTTPALAGPATTPALAIVQKQPLTVTGVHFKRRERVHLTAVAGRTSATASGVTTRFGRLRVTFRGYNGDSCNKLVITATGARGDHARLVLAPPPGTEIPCPA